MQQIMDPGLLSITPSSAPKECRGFARLRDQTAFKNAVGTQLVSSFIRAKKGNKRGCRSLLPLALPGGTQEL